METSVWPRRRLTPDRGQEEEHTGCDGGHLMPHPVVTRSGITVAAETNRGRARKIGEVELNWPLILLPCLIIHTDNT